MKVAYLSICRFVDRAREYPNLKHRCPFLSCSIIYVFRKLFTVASRYTSKILQGNQGWPKSFSLRIIIKIFCLN